MPNASETLCFLAFVMIVIIACQLQSIHASFPVAANLSLLRHPSIRRRSTGGPRLHHGGNLRKTHPNSEAGDPITQHYVLYHACSNRLVRIFGGKIDARGKQDSTYIQLRATTDSFDRIRIQSVMTGGFVCLNRRARLVAKADGADVGCYFKETMTVDFFTEFQSTYNTSWYIGFNQRGSALRGSHWMTHAGNQKAIKCRKFIKKSLRPESRKMKETGEVKIKGTGGKGTAKVAGDREIKGSGVKRKKTGNADNRPTKHNAERRRMKDDGIGSREYRTG